ALSTEVQTKASLAVPIGVSQLGYLYVKYLDAHPQGEIAKAADYPSTFKLPADQKKPLTGPQPKADAKPPASNIPVDCHFFPAMWPSITGRALVIGGFHGDEHPGWEVTDQLVSELSQPAGATGL